MGKGDQRSRRGKIFAGSFGKRRPKPRKHHAAGAAGAAAAAESARTATPKEPKVVKKQPRE